MSGDLKLMPFGENFVGVSPFRKGSVICVSPQHQRFHCLLSGHKGDVITYRKMKDRSDFVTAVEKLAKVSGIRLEYEDQFADAKQKAFVFEQRKAS